MTSQPLETQADGRRTAAAARRRRREKEILDATRALFDARGVRDAQIEDIAHAVGINRAIIYRHFTGKEELFALTLVGYLDELHGAARRPPTTPTPPPDGAARARSPARSSTTALEHPAFVDCAQTLMRRTGPELLDEITESALFRLGRGISALPARTSPTRPRGRRRSRRLPDRRLDLLANTLYASGLGALQLARVGMLVKEAAPGVPTVGTGLARPGHSELPRRHRAWPSPPAELYFSAQHSATTSDAVGGAQRSRIAVTPWPPAAQIEITPRPGPVLAAFSASSLARVATIRPPVAANG